MHPVRLRRLHDERVPLPEIPPRCDCGALLRPGVVWFGEGLPADVWDNAYKAVCAADVLLVAGTSCRRLSGCVARAICESSPARLLSRSIRTKRRSRLRSTTRFGEAPGKYCHNYSNETLLHRRIFRNQRRHDCRRAARRRSRFRRL